jgi:hypothetical protein
VTAVRETIRRCRRGDRCADARTHTTTLPDGTTGRARLPAWSTEDGDLCHVDTTHVLRAVEQLPRDYLELGLLLGKTGGSHSAPTGGTRDLPVPLRLGVLTLQEAIVTELAIWAGPVAELDGFSFTETGRPEHRVRYASGWIVGRWPSLLSVPPIDVARLDGREERLSGRNAATLTEEDGVDGALGLLALHERVEQVEGRTHRAHQLWSPCPRCQTLALRREEGSPHVVCQRCGHLMNMDQYDQLADVLAHANGAGAAA